MKLVPISLQGTSSTGGALTVNAENVVLGLLYAVEWIDGDFADGVDAVLSVQGSQSAVAKTVLTLTDANVDKTYYPRSSAQDLAGVDAEVAATFDWRVLPIVDGRLRLVVASAGNAKTGGCIAYIQE